MAAQVAGVGPAHPRVCPPSGSCSCSAMVVGPGTSSWSLSSFCRNLKIGYFSQHHVDQLDLNISAVELLARKFPGEFWRSQGIGAIEVSFATGGAALIGSMGRKLCHISAQGTPPALGELLTSSQVQDISHEKPGEMVSCRPQAGVPPWLGFWGR